MRPLSVLRGCAITATLALALPMAWARKSAPVNAAPAPARARQDSAPQASPSKPPAWNSNLESVLNIMDAAAAKFRSAEADFTWDQYTKVVDDNDVQKGKIYFRRSGNEIQMAADVTEPKDSAKSVVVSDGKVQIYQPQSNQVNIYSEGKNREEFESFLLLGFGARGHDMLKSFDLTFLGPENLNGVETAKLQLIPKSQKVRNNFDRILLWIDQQGLLLQQQIFSGEDYKLTKYSNIQLKGKLSESAFKLKTNSKTTFITH
jgi:outer membrane lipoprotein-sorting protein